MICNNGAWTEEDLVFLPLGGAGEIGMNLNLYGYAGQWLIVDCGVMFGDDYSPRFYPGVVRAVDAFTEELGLEYEVLDEQHWIVRKPLEN